MPPDAWMRSNTSAGAAASRGMNAGRPRASQFSNASLDAGHIAAGHQRPGDPRPARSLAAIVEPGLDDRVGVQMNAERGQPLDDLPHPIEAAAALFDQKRVERLAMPIDEIAQDVDVHAVTDRGDFDARHELDAGGGAGLGGGVAAGHRVVVGHGEHRDAGSGRARHELRRRASAVGRRRVGVEIDHRADARPGRAARRRGRRCRSRSARYSRTSSSWWARSSSANSRKTCLPSESSKRSP